MPDLMTSPQFEKGRRLENDGAVSGRYKLNDLFCSLWLSLAVCALVEKRVFDCIDDGGSTCADIARRSKLHEPSLYRALRALAANGLLIQSDNSTFQHTDASRLLRTDHPHSWSGMAKMWGHPSCIGSWQKFALALEDGVSAVTHAFGKPLYEHLNDNPDALRQFSDAMVSNSAHPASAIAKALASTNRSSVVDLGGGIGTLLGTILQEHRNWHGVLFEIPELVGPAESYLNSLNLDGRFDVIAGDFTQCVPDGIDLYLIKNSMWNWQDETALAIIKNVRQAIGTNTQRRFVIIEYVISEDNAPWTTLYDLQMLNLPGGRARTLDEYKTLLNRGGFSIGAVDIVQDQTLITAVPS